METIDEKSEIRKLPRRHSSRKKSNRKRKLQCNENIGFSIEPITDNYSDPLTVDEAVVDRTFITDLDDTYQKVTAVPHNKNDVNNNSDLDGSVLHSLENTIEYQKSV